MHFSGIPTESDRIHWNLSGMLIPLEFQWKLFWEAPGFWPFLLDSVRFCWNYNGIGNQNGWGSSHLDSIRIPWNSDIPFGICWNSWGMVKTSPKTEICNHFNSFNSCSNSSKNCHFWHACKWCKQMGHGQESCNVKEGSSTWNLP